MVFIMVLIGLTGQNAENALFEKSPILVEFSGQKLRIYLFVEMEWFLFLIVVGETVGAAISSFSLSVLFRSLFISKI